jgi:hypothetical protein
MSDKPEGLFRIKIKRDGKWTTIEKTWNKWEALDSYNGTPTPKMLTCSKGIIHKQYSDNGFIFVGR